jgi:nicotinic acid mononucleotide adenylyltransferase
VDPPAITAALLRALVAGLPRLEVVGDVPERIRRVGLVSGSFDPMTRAHAALAEALRDRGSDLVLMVYSPRTMPKAPGGEPPLMTPERRMAAVAAWCSSEPGMAAAVCSHGLLTDQVEAAATAFPRAELVLGVGSDKVLQLFDQAWYEDRTAALDSLFRRARVAYALRLDHGQEVERTLGTHPRWARRIDRIALVEPVTTLSSSDVRRRVRRGENVAELVPAEVLPFLPGPDAR